MKYFLGLLCIVFLFSCSESGKQPTRKFDYSDFKSHELSKLHIKLKLPNDFEYFEFNQMVLDSLMEESKTKSYDRRRNLMISSLFTQKQGKLEVFVDHKNQRYFTIATFPHTNINEKLVKQMGQGMKGEIQKINTDYGYDIHLTEAIIGNAGRVNYALFKTKSSFGNNFSFMVTLGLRSWRMNYYGDNNFDYEEVLNSVEFPK